MLLSACASETWGRWTSWKTLCSCWDGQDAAWQGATETGRRWEAVRLSPCWPQDEPPLVRMCLTGTSAVICCSVNIKNLFSHHVTIYVLPTGMLSNLLRDFHHKKPSQLWFQGQHFTWIWRPRNLDLKLIEHSRMWISMSFLSDNP